MAGIALAGGDQVCWWFARCGTAVVAAAAQGSDIAVIETCRTPGAGVVAGVTVIIGLYMAARQAVRNEPVVAGFAGADDRTVVDPADAAEADGVMAVIAYRRGQHMRR